MTFPSIGSITIGSVLECSSEYKVSENAPVIGKTGFTVKKTMLCFKLLYLNHLNHVKTTLIAAIVSLRDELYFIVKSETI